ncbi:putative 2-aminoethylphosphonate ABC transporter permease subunit [Paenibacillus oleatilyticus]|uniref:putative 2-aminoethylphosphonate ABC transporter permease subunit n=1 Tax=Paenibacillus oleatilyticus TaxID=2594886 RepID=UPI001C1F1FD2|nr:putative 2-aminoethylphosphonate ABC transporter permease subunit [Paenibacillus oleatilyticus]MBU7315667.1 putative 2-aminoethylphosphonate ABC transporter permease subunit [Paenibacillus oleatilyticus]
MWTARTRALSPKAGGAELWQMSLVVIVVLLLLTSVLFPLGVLFAKAFLDREGAFVGLANFVRYFSTPALSRSLTNTIYVSVVSTGIAVTLAFFYAYGVIRTAIRGKGFFKTIALVPLFAPTMMHGIALTYLFGNQGLVTNGLFGLVPGFEIELYGPVGIIMAEVIYLFPQAFLILAASLAVTDYRLYEAAETLGAGKLKRLLTVTLPSVKFGLISAIFVCFTACFTDFGAPQVIGGKFNVLATDIYKQVIGQQNMSMGAAVGILLTIPAVVAFVVDRLVQRRQNALITSKSTPYRIANGRLRDKLFTLFCTLMSIGILIPLLTIVYASLVNVWPYNLTLSLKHFDFSAKAAAGFEPFWNSLVLSLLTAVLGTLFAFVTAYLIEKTRMLRSARQLGYFLAILPLSLPGMVIGLAYIFFFNAPDNPLHPMYGTVAILVLANVVHFFSVPFITAMTTLKKQDKEFELVAESMRVPFYRTFLKVTVPLSLPAIIEMAMYFFVNSMVTVSALVFLTSPDFKLAAVSIVHMDDAGDTAAAAAMSVLILGTNIAIRLLYELILRGVRRRTEAWQVHK